VEHTKGRGLANSINYGDAIRQGFEHLLQCYPEVFVIGQGLWSPWYVGASMTNLEIQFGKERVIDTPVSEAACTGAAVGAAIAGKKPIVVHPRMDFMLYAIDPIVNQAAKWSHMFGGQGQAGVTVRGIINRRGEQGAQHSQALHAWFAHVPGLKVVMPTSALDARDLLIASVLSPDPVIYIDDRALYQDSEPFKEIRELNLAEEGPKLGKLGNDITLVGVGEGAALSLKAAALLESKNLSADVIDVRVLNPFNSSLIEESVSKTGRLICVDPGTLTAGFSGEIICSVVENIPLHVWKQNPVRISLPDAPAPTSTYLEDNYYYSEKTIYERALELIKSEKNE